MSNLTQFLIILGAVVAGIVIGKSVWPATFHPPVPILPSPFQSGGFWVILKASGPNKILTIKALREAMALGLKDAKDIADRTPAAVITVTTREEALRIAKHFQGVASVEILSPTGWTSYNPENGMMSTPSPE